MKVLLLSTVLVLAVEGSASAQYPEPPTPPTPRLLDPVVGAIPLDDARTLVLGLPGPILWSCHDYDDAAYHRICDLDINRADCHADERSGDHYDRHYKSCRIVVGALTVECTDSGSHSYYGGEFTDGQDNRACRVFRTWEGATVASCEDNSRSYVAYYPETGYGQTNERHQRCRVGTVSYACDSLKPPYGPTKKSCRLEGVPHRGA